MMAYGLGRNIALLKHHFNHSTPPPNSLSGLTRKFATYYNTRKFNFKAEHKSIQFGTLNNFVSIVSQILHLNYKVQNRMIILTL